MKYPRRICLSLPFSYKKLEVGIYIDFQQTKRNSAIGSYVDVNTIGLYPARKEDFEILVSPHIYVTMKMSGAPLSSVLKFESVTLYGAIQALQGMRKDLVIQDLYYYDQGILYVNDEIAMKTARKLRALKNKQVEIRHVVVVGNSSWEMRDSERMMVEELKQIPRYEGIGIYFLGDDTNMAAFITTAELEELIRLLSSINIPTLAMEAANLYYQMLSHPETLSKLHFESGVYPDWN